MITWQNRPRFLSMGLLSVIKLGHVNIRTSAHLSR